MTQDLLRTQFEFLDALVAWRDQVQTILRCRITLVELGVAGERKVQLGTGQIVLGKDCVHMRAGITPPGKDEPATRDSNHYNRLAADANIYERVTEDAGNGWARERFVYVPDGGHPLWLQAGPMWERIDPRARWGGRFGDANHLSFEWGGAK